MKIIMERNFNKALQWVLEHEGGFADHPRDPGGATNMGITLETFRRYIKPGGTVDDLKALTRAQAAVVYRRQYWDKVRGNELPTGMDYSMFDFAVNSGWARAVSFIQQQLGVPVDGRLGPRTMDAIMSQTKNQNVYQGMIATYNDNRLNWLRTLSHWDAFGNGWKKRVQRVRSRSLLWAAGQQPVERPTNRPGETAPGNFWAWLVNILTMILKSGKRPPNRKEREDR